MKQILTISPQLFNDFLMTWKYAFSYSPNFSIINRNLS